MKPHSAPLFDKIRTARNLPTLPHILLRLIETCNSPDSSIAEISRIMDKDSSLSAKVMRMVNSVHYGLPTKITSVEQALLLLGTNAVKNIAVSAAVFQVFGKARGDDVFNLKTFWYHSLLCGTTGELIARQTGYDAPDEAFLAGLLHDIGKMVLWVHFPKDYKEVILTSETQSDTVTGEKQRFGVHHGEVGSWMIEKWNLQSFMADSVLFHHEPVENIRDALPLVKIVFLANILSQNAKGQTETAKNMGKELFDFSHDDINTIVSHAEEQVTQTAQSLGVEVAPPQETNDPEDGFKEEVDLLRTVRDASLLQGTLQNLLQAYGRKAILAVVKQGIQVLFDMDHMVFLLYDQEKNILQGQEGTEPSKDLLAREVSISMDSENSLPVQALREKSPYDSFGQLKKRELSILDRQLIRLLGKDGMIALPMIAHQHSVGVILLGMDRTELSTLFNQLNLLKMLVDQAALALYADHLRKTQAERVQVERLAAASSVARKVVHEVNNPLGIIKNYIKIFGLKLSQDDPVQEDLKIINEELDRVALIIHGLSNFSEPEIKQTEPVDVNGLLSALVKITQESYARNGGISIHLELDKDLPIIFSQKNGLKQVFVNLIKNAAEAMPQGGNLNISTRNASKRQETTEKGRLHDYKDTIEVRIHDDGHGIPEEIQLKLFEPYVTTKEGNHAGLGLSVVYNIIKELNGSISCKSDKTNGTAFTIQLPVGAGATGQEE